MMSSPAHHKHLQLNKVSMGPDSFHLFPVSSAACQRCPPRGCMMALVVPSTSFPSAASQAGRKGRHFLLIFIYSLSFFFYHEVSSGRLLTSHWSVLGHMTLPGCKRVWESKPTWQLWSFLGVCFYHQARKGRMNAVGNWPAASTRTGMTTQKCTFL